MIEAATTILLLLAFVGLPAFRLWQSRRRDRARRLAREESFAQMYARTAASTETAVEAMRRLGEKMKGEKNA